MSELRDSFPDALCLTQRSRLRRRLLAWFDRHQRHLPWRQRKSRYRVWISEIMLQQTQVATVLEYYPRFLRQFPNVRRLAEAEIDEVLRLWEGLGYYRRARQLHAAAQQIVQRHGGRFPSDYESVLALPGIGRYTAGAILSIAEDQRLPILEGNTQRLYARLLGLRTDPRGAAEQRQLWTLAETLLPVKRVGDFNQALMELGATVCKPRTPDCVNCPLQSLCPTRLQGLQGEIPFRGPGTQYESVREAVVLVERRKKFLVRRCGLGERWAGMWDFLRFSADPGTSKRTPSADGNSVDRIERLERLERRVFESTGLSVQLTSLDHVIRHAVTRYRIELHCYRARQVAGRLARRRGVEMEWAAAERIAELPLSATARRIARKFIETVG